MKTTTSILAAITLAAVVAACTGAGASPTPPAASPSPSTPGASPPPSAQPTPTVPPSLAPSPTLRPEEEAAARVIASDSRFSGIVEQDRNMIGQGSWWRAEAYDGGHRVQVEIGWGDCPAGCINRHVWIFDVANDGTITLVEESGDPFPATYG